MLTNIEGYCMKCKDFRPIVAGVIMSKYSSLRMRGKCQICNALIVKKLSRQQTKDLTLYLHGDSE